jgi:hypothetical protein
VTCREGRGCESGRALVASGVRRICGGGRSEGLPSLSGWCSLVLHVLHLLLLILLLLDSTEDWLRV